MGKNKYIETPERLWELFEEYVLHERNNPMFKREYVGKDGIEKNTPLETPITFEGFECYLSDMGVIEDLSHYAANSNGAYDNYCTIITRIRKNCYVHNLKGAAVGLFNANLIARKLGLTEKTDNTNRSEVKILNIDPLDDSSDNSVKEDSDPS